MNNKVISVEHLSKKYDLGLIGTGSLVRDFERWAAKVRGRPDPYSIIGQQTHTGRVGETILALDDVSFAVQQGEALGIVGRNGAGKSTLLKILSRVTAPSEGCVKVKGRIGSLLEVGTGFHPDLTGRENVFLNGAILGMKKAEVARKFDEIVAFSGVEQFIDTPVKRYSSGMYVRLAFAVAAHLDPEILIVDEVLAVGDAEFQKKCLGKMGDAAGEGRTVLFVSHNMDSIVTLCEHALWLKDSKVHLTGFASDVVNAYLNDFSEGRQSDLASRTDRSGSLIAKFVNVKLSTTEDGVPRATVFTGEELHIRICIDSQVETDVFLGIQVKDHSGRTVTSFNSRECGLSISIHPGMNFVNLYIPSMLLLEGVYLIDGAIVETNSLSSFDRINNITTFTVFTNDFLGTGAAFRAYHGLVVIPHTWKTQDNQITTIAFTK